MTDLATSLPAALRPHVPDLRVSRLTAMATDRPLRIGTRGSALARWQAEWVAERLQEHGYKTELVHIATKGDEQQIAPIGMIGTQGVFTKELQRALLDGRIDLSVHSLKDLPTEQIEGLCLAAVPPRETVSDVLISRSGQPFEELRSGAVIGTGSLRRQAQLLHARPDLKTQDIRGNVDTRLRKLHEGDYDALVLAEAGLKRLGLIDQVTQVLPKSVLLPAVGQGALGLETRADDETTRAALANLDHPPSHQAVLAERALLATLRGGCLAPIGAWATLEFDGKLQLTAVALDRHGVKRLEATGSAQPDKASELGREVAQRLIAQGALELLAQSRAQ